MTMMMVRTAAASIGRLGLAAAAFGRPTLASAGKGPGTPLSTRGSRYELLVNAAVAAGWLSERRALYGHALDRDAKVMVTAKDVLVAGTVLTGAAIVLGRALARREAAADEPLSGEGESSPHYVQAMAGLNRGFAVLGVTATPFINFALFDSYHPHPLRSFVSLR
jgi:hypothetical protein